MRMQHTHVLYLALSTISRAFDFVLSLGAWYAAIVRRATVPIIDLNLHTKQTVAVVSALHRILTKGETQSLLRHVADHFHWIQFGLCTENLIEDLRCPCANRQFNADNGNNCRLTNNSTVRTLNLIRNFNIYFSSFSSLLTFLFASYSIERLFFLRSLCFGATFVSACTVADNRTTSVQVFDSVAM